MEITPLKAFIELVDKDFNAKGQDSGFHKKARY